MTNGLERKESFLYFEIKKNLKKGAMLEHIPFQNIFPFCSLFLYD